MQAALRPEADPGELATARAALAETLPWLERRAMGRSGGPAPYPPEDLVQGTVTAALARIEAEFQRSGRTPAWCQDDERLRRYLSGALRRTRQRLRRDSRTWREVSLSGDVAASDRATAQVEPCTDLQGFVARDLRWFSPVGEPGDLDALARALGCSPAALAKRRVRAMQRLKARCATCVERREHGCAFAALVRSS